MMSVICDVNDQSDVSDQCDVSDQNYAMWMIQVM